MVLVPGKVNKRWDNQSLFFGKNTKTAEDPINRNKLPTSMPQPLLSIYQLNQKNQNDFYHIKAH